jgi:hypothetical protein
MSNPKPKRKAPTNDPLRPSPGRRGGSQGQLSRININDSFPLSYTNQIGYKSQLGSIQRRSLTLRKSITERGDAAINAAKPHFL